MNHSEIAATVDHLGDIKAEIADLKIREKHAKTLLIDAGVTVAEGDLFRVTISTADRITLDSKKVRAFLTAVQISEASRTTPVTTVRIAARVGA